MKRKIIITEEDDGSVNVEGDIDLANPINTHRIFNKAIREVKIGHVKHKKEKRNGD